MWEAAAGGMGKLIDAGVSWYNAKNNISWQKKFARNAIQWKVKDAKAAGIHPLAALGASTHSFQPVSLGTDFGSMGQGIGRAIDATADKEQRQNADAGTAMQKLQLENAALQNQKLAAEIAITRQAGSPPPFPLDNTNHTKLMIEGQGNSPLVKTKAVERQAASPTNPGSEAGSFPDISWSNNGDGSFTLLPGKDVKDRIEDFSVPQWQWSIRNLLTPGSASFPYPAPAGQSWVYNPLTGRSWLVKHTGAGRFSQPNIRR